MKQSFDDFRTETGKYRAYKSIQKQTAWQWIAMVIGAVVTFGGFIYALHQLDIFSMQDGWNWVSKKQYAKDMKSLNDKVDNLPSKLAEELHKDGRH